MWYFDEADAEDLPAARVALEFGAALPDGFSATRPGPALGRDSTGHWVAVAENVLRTWYDPITLVGPFAVIEPQRTQYVHRSREPLLTATQASIRVDPAAPTPFGPGALVITPLMAMGVHGWEFAFDGVVAAPLPEDTTVALNAVVRLTGASRALTLSLRNRSGTFSEVRFELEGRGLVVSRAGVGHAQIERDTDGYYSLQIVHNFGTGATPPACNAIIHDAAGLREYVADGASGLEVAYLGVEAGAEVTSPILNPLDTATVRSADVVTGEVPWMVEGPKSLGLDYIPLSRTSSVIFQMIGADTLQVANGLADVGYAAATASTVAASITAAAPAPGVERSVVVTAANNSFLLAQDGLVLGTDLSGPAPSNFSTMRIGAQVNGLSSGPLLLRRIKYWSEALPAALAESFSRDLAQGGAIAPLPVIGIQPEFTAQPSETVVSLTVVLSGQPTGVRVGYRIVDGTALAGRDYVGAAGTLEIDTGQSSGTIQIGLTARTTIEDRGFRVELLSPSGAALGNAACVVRLLRVPTPSAPASTQTTFGSSLPATVSLARGSPAWTRDSAGAWVQVATNGHRHHHLSAGVSGLLIEPFAAEQRLYDSVDCNFTASGGVKTVVTTGDSPAGARVLQFRESVLSEQHRVLAALNTTYADHPTGEYTSSVMIRPVGGRRYFRLVSKAYDNISYTIHFDAFGAGAISSTDAGVAVGIERDPFRTEWYRVWVSHPQTANAGVVPTFGITVENVSQTVTIAGIDGAGFDIGHVQIEPGQGMSSPIIVTGATAKTVRQPDILRAAGAWSKLDSYTLGLRFLRLRDQPAVQRLISARDSSAAQPVDDIGFTVNSGLLTGKVRINNVEYPAMTGPAVPLGVPTTVLLTVNPIAKVALYSEGAKIGEQAVTVT